MKPRSHEGHEETRRGKVKKRRSEEGEKISSRFPQTFEAAAFFSIHINCKRFLPGWLVQVRKPLDGAYAPFVAPRAAGPLVAEGIENE